MRQVPVVDSMFNTAEQHRLAEARTGAADWRRWGTYLSERAWGTVREDYSADGNAWDAFPFEQAASRAYRWNEDGLAGWCDRDQTIILALALWNGRDPILKERPYGLNNAQGNHGEDVKEYWFYTDNLPTHTYASMIYKYPQDRFPYEDLLATNASRGQDLGEYELYDALEEGWLANRYFDVEVQYAKPLPEGVVMRITVTNRGPEAAPIHVLPQLWYRNTWSWDPAATRPAITRTGPGLVETEHPLLGRRWLHVTASDHTVPELLFCDNETNSLRLWGVPNTCEHPKDAIADYVIHGDADAVSRDAGSKMAAHYQTVLAPGASVHLTLRFTASELDEPFDDSDEILAHRRNEADHFYRALADSAPAGGTLGLDGDLRLVQRQALAGLLWCKQYYHYEVRQWLRGDPGQPVPPASRWQGRNSDWQHVVHADVILMPDAWEYPWYAAWDLAFHCVTMALIDPDFAKDQLLLLLSSVTQHPHGQIPAYEWNFGDTNPPLHAWACWQVYQMELGQTGHADRAFLAAAYRAITLDVMWWLNQKDAQNRGVFGGGFLGMDNIGVFDRDQPLPTGGDLAQVDGTSWVATMLMQMIEMTVELAQEDPNYDRMFGRWIWDGWMVANALEKGWGEVSFWNEETGFYHDLIETPDGGAIPLEVFSMQSLTPLFACIAVPSSARRQIELLVRQSRELRSVYRQGPGDVRVVLPGGDGSHVMMAAVHTRRLRTILKRVLDPDQFLSDYGIRSISAYHREHPYVYRAEGQQYSVDYMPGESRNRMFGGNSNWRGPIWMPMNFLLVQSLNAYARFYGDTFTVPDPTGSAEELKLADVADDLARRLVGIFTRDDTGRRPVFGGNDYFNNDPHWRDLVPFHEYFDGDTGRGVGASHQTGWTAVVALFIQYGGDLRFADMGG